MHVKERAKQLNVSQVKLIKALNERGQNVNPGEMCQILNEYLVTPKAKRVLSLCDTILDEIESSKC